MFDKNSTIEISDPAVWEIIQKEGKRQEDQIELIAISMPKAIPASVITAAANT